MVLDSSATKARILEAAYREFAAFGLAGARIDRIAANAGANKRAIYQYFGPKEELFDVVLRERLEAGATEVPASWHDLPQYAADVFDFYLADPDRRRLTLWRQLERPDPIPGEVDFYSAKIEALRAERSTADPLDAIDVYAIVWAIHHTPFLMPTALKEIDGQSSWSPERIARQKAAIVETVRRLTAPDKGP